MVNNQKIEFEDFISNFAITINRLSSNPDKQIYYRGHSENWYKLEPSIYRNSSFIKNEHNIIRDAIANNSQEFENHKNLFDKLTLMQHYEFPTRLLDITTNPYVALFFAILGQTEGRNAYIKVFHIPHKNIKNFDSDSVSILSAMAFLAPEKFNDFNEEIKTLLNKEKTKIKEKEKLTNDEVTLFDEKIKFIFNSNDITFEQSKLSKPNSDNKEFNILHLIDDLVQLKIQDLKSLNACIQEIEKLQKQFKDNPEIKKEHKAFFKDTKQTLAEKINNLKNTSTKKASSLI